MRLRLTQDLASGLLLTGIGLACVVGSLHYRLGTLLQMGPGYFPFLAGCALSFVGLLATLPSLREEGQPLEKIELRHLFFVLLSILLFALFIRSLGLLPTVAMVIITAAFAESETDWRQVLYLNLFMLPLVWLVFIVGLNLAIPSVTFKF